MVTSSCRMILLHVCVSAEATSKWRKPIVGFYLAKNLPLLADGRRFCLRRKSHTGVPIHGINSYTSARTKKITLVINVY